MKIYRIRRKADGKFLDKKYRMFWKEGTRGAVTYSMRIWAERMIVRLTKYPEWGTLPSDYEIVEYEYTEEVVK